MGARSSHADPNTAWSTELERVASEWQKGKRQHLTLALSCYGLSDLGLPFAQVQNDLLELARQKGDTEISTRAATTNTTRARIPAW